QPPRPTPFPYTTLFRSEDVAKLAEKPPAEARGAALRRPRAWLGFKSEVLTPELVKAHGLATDQGVRISKVFPGTVGEKVGLKTRSEEHTSELQSPYELV